MSRRSRANRLKNRGPQNGHTATSQSQAAQRPDYLFTDDVVDVQIFPDIDPAPEMFEPGPQQGPFEPGGYARSRCNATREGLRARLVFPEQMLQLIETEARGYTTEWHAVGRLEHWLCAEMGRATVQIDTAEKQLLFDMQRLLRQIPTGWDDRQQAFADQSMRKLARDPATVAAAMGRSKHGTLLLIKAWNGLGTVVRNNGKLNDAQVQFAYDLLGLQPVLRDGSDEVPAATDAPALTALVTREVSRHERNLIRKLNGDDLSDQDQAGLGIFKQHDQATRNLRADRSRARRRLSWAIETLQLLRAGVPAETLIDPETGKPIQPRAYAAAGCRPAQAAPAASAPTAPPASDSTSPQPDVPRTTIKVVLPEGLRPDVREKLLNFFEAFVADMVAQSVAVSPTGDLASKLEPLPD